MTVPAADNLRLWNLDPKFAPPAALSEAADLLEAIDALPDTTYEASAWNDGYEFAMRQVKALLHPPVPAEETLPNTPTAQSVNHEGSKS